MVRKKQRKNMIKHMFSKKSKAKNSSSKLHTYTNSYHKKLSNKEQRRRNFHKNAPDSRLKRIFWRMHPKHVMSYWFSKELWLEFMPFTKASFLILTKLIVESWLKQPSSMIEPVKHCFLKFMVIRIELWSRVIKFPTISAMLLLRLKIKTFTITAVLVSVVFLELSLITLVVRAAVRKVVQQSLSN